MPLSALKLVSVLVVAVFHASSGVALPNPIAIVMRPNHGGGVTLPNPVAPDTHPNHEAGPMPARKIGSASKSLSWNAAVKKGRKLNKAIDKKPAKAVPFKRKLTDLGKFGWDKAVDADVSDNAEESNALVMKSLNITIPSPDNIQITWTNSKAWKGHMPTAANVSAIYNSRAGILFVTQIPSTIVKGPFQWSDIIPLVLENDHANTNISRVVMSDVRDENTVGIINKIVEEAGGLKTDGPGKNIFTYPGTKYDVKNTEKFALLGSPIGYGAGSMLSKHKKTFRDMHMNAIQLYCVQCNTSAPGWNMIFNISPLTDRALTSLEAKQGTIASNHKTPKHPRGDRAPKPGSGGGVQQKTLMTVKTAIEKGRDSVKGLAAEKGLQTSKWTSEQDLRSQGWESKGPVGMLPIALQGDFKRILQDMYPSTAEVQSALRKANYQEWLHTRYAQNVGSSAPPDREVKAKNSGYFAPGVIIAKDNISPKAAIANTPDGFERLQRPELEDWSDIVSILYRQFKEYDLKGVVRYAVTNKDTVNVWKELRAKHGFDEEYAFPGKTFLPGSDVYLAMMGTPNGRGVYYLLNTNRELYGWKYVESIQIWTVKIQKSLVIWYKFGDGSIHMTSHHRRGDKVSKPGPSDGLKIGTMTLKQAIEKGRDSVKGLTAAKGPKSSYRWKSRTDLTKHGWKQVVDQTATDDNDFEDDLDGDIERVLEAVFMNKGKAKDAMRMTIHQEWTHEQTAEITVNGKKQHRPLPAVNEIYFSPGMIFAANIESPKSAASKVPAGSKVAPGPGFNQWSDIAAVLYNAAFEGHDREGVVQHAITNDDAFKVFKEMREQESALIQENFEWPGVNFKPGSEQYLALMGIPNGRSVYHLLNTNRDTLGWKYVESIQVWTTETHKTPVVWYKFGRGEYQKKARSRAKL